MPRFYFHVRGARQELSLDELGLDFPDAETAYRETFCAARDVRAVFAACGRHPRDYTIEVVNGAGQLIFRVPFSEALNHGVPHLTTGFYQ